MATTDPVMNENQNELKGISLYHSNTNMNTIQLVEKIHKRQGLYVASLKKSEFFEMFPFDDGEERFLLAKDSTEKKLKQADYFKLIQSYIQRHVKSDFKGIKITYGFSNGKTCGRMYAQDPMAIQRLNRQLRAFLTQGLYHDYDMKSAHPTFVRHLCEGKAYCETTYQDKYLNDRTRLLKEGNTDKHTMLAKLNTDDARFYKTKSEDLWGLVKEWNLIKAHYFPLLMDDFPPNQASKNPMSSTMNQKLCAMENEILQVAIRNNEPAVLMFDGFMTEKDVGVSSLPSDIVVWEEKPVETEHVVPDSFDEGLIIRTVDQY